MSGNGKNKEKKREVYRISFDYKTHGDVIELLSRVPHVYRGIIIADALRFFAENSGYFNVKFLPNIEYESKKTVVADEAGIDLSRSFEL